MWLWVLHPSQIGAILSLTLHNINLSLIWHIPVLHMGILKPLLNIFHLLVDLNLPVMEICLVYYLKGMQSFGSNVTWVSWLGSYLGHFVISVQLVAILVTFSAHFSLHQCACLSFLDLSEESMSMCVTDASLNTMSRLQNPWTIWYTLGSNSYWQMSIKK